MVSLSVSTKYYCIRMCFYQCSLLVSQLLERCRSLVLQLSRVSSSGREEHLKDSVARALMLMLSELNTNYSASCAAYTQC